jgi:PhnB protein
MASLGHAEMELGDTRMMLADESPQRNVKSPASLGGLSVHLMVYVEDSDAAMKQALGHGQRSVRPPVDAEHACRGHLRRGDAAARGRDGERK